MPPSELLERLTDRAAHAGVAIPPAMARRLVEYYELLERWNRTINLTSLRDPDAAMDRLLIEPFAASAFLPAHPRLMDIGSGGGSPAIPLAMALDAGSLVMVESHRRKAAFLREAARQLEMPHVHVHDARLDTFSAASFQQKRPNLISVRAVRLEASLMKMLKELLEPGGELALFSSETALPEVASIGLRIRSTHPLPGSATLVLVA